MEGDFACFGERRLFSIEARLVADPDPAGGPLEDAWSFGEFRIFVRGRCLTRHTAPGGMRDEIRWYLAPLLRWLSVAWSPLLHEQRFPLSIGSHEHPIVRFEQGERRLLDDISAEGSARRREMQAWRRRHSLWTAAAGGVLPNIWFRRQSDLCEIAYDPGATVGAPAALEFQFSRGVAMVDVDAVAKPLLSLLQWGARVAADAGAEVVLPDPSAAAIRTGERWLIGDHLFDILAERGLSAAPSVDGILYPMTPEVAMFGTLTPNLSRQDAVKLLAVLEGARSEEPEPPGLTSLVTEMTPPTRETSWAQGYDLALQTQDTLQIGGRSGFINIVRILGQLGVAMRDCRVEDTSLRGVAIAGDGFQPTIVVNAQARWNQGGAGRRFTLAHEFGHILVDRGRARRVTHSSTPWAPEAVERRANAFAAMFLMPYSLVDRALAAVGGVGDRASLARVSRRLACGKGAVLEHLKNIDRIDESTFFRLKSELAYSF